MSEIIEQSNTCEKSFPFMARVIAEMYGLKVDTVRKVKSHRRSDNTEMGETIAIADHLLSEGFSKLIEQVKQIVPFHKG